MELATDGTRGTYICNINEIQPHFHQFLKPGGISDLGFETMWNYIDEKIRNIVTYGALNKETSNTASNSKQNFQSRHY